MMFAGLTDTELDQLSERVYRAVTRLFDTVTLIHGQMAQTATWTPQYAEMRGRTAVLMASGREQNQLHDELVAEVRERREHPAEAIRRRDAILAEWEEDNAVMREAILNENWK